MTSFLKVLKRNIACKHHNKFKRIQLTEEWDENKELLVEGLTFYVKYLGSCLVGSSSGEESTATAIKNIVAMAKASGRKLEKVALTVTPKSIRTCCLISQDLLFEVPINRISYCSADAHYDYVFAFIQSNLNDILECRAFLCANKKMAQAATLTISQAFNLAYDLWQTTRNDYMKQDISKDVPSDAIYSSEYKVEDELPALKDETLLIDFGDDAGKIDLESKRSTENKVLLQNKKFIWDQSFTQLPPFSMVPRLRTNLCPDGVSNATKLVSQFVAKNRFDCECDRHFFPDDNSDLLAL